jgi:hypothetical protein
MSEFTFISRDVESTGVPMDFNAEYLPDVLEKFELFLKGVGFVFNGNLVILDSDDIECCENDENQTINFSGGTSGGRVCN